MASYFYATKEANKQNKDGSYTLAMKVKAGDMPIWLQNAPMGEELLIGALDRGHGRDKALAKEMNERATDARKKMASFPQDPIFQQWIAERYDHWSLIARAAQVDSESIEIAVIETLKRICGIGSRRNLSFDRDALERFETVMNEFYRDMSLDFQKNR